MKRPTVIIYKVSFYFAFKIILGNFWHLVGDDRGYIKG